MTKAKIIWQEYCDLDDKSNEEYEEINKGMRSQNDTPNTIRWAEVLLKLNNKQL